MAGRLISRAVFALAAACALGASTGVAVAPHEEAPGTPPHHDEPFSAYRYGFLLGAPVVHHGLSPEMAALHRTLEAAGVPRDVVSQMPMERVSTSTDSPAFESAPVDPVQSMAIAFALLVLLTARLARPTLRKVAEISLPAIPAELWSLAPPLSPPRLLVLP